MLTTPAVPKAAAKSSCPVGNRPNANVKLRQIPAIAKPVKVRAMDHQWPWIHSMVSKIILLPLQKKLGKNMLWVILLVSEQNWNPKRFKIGLNWINWTETKSIRKPDTKWEIGPKLDQNWTKTRPNETWWNCTKNVTKTGPKLDRIKLLLYWTKTWLNLD